MTVRIQVFHGGDWYWLGDDGALELDPKKAARFASLAAALRVTAKWLDDPARLPLTIDGVRTI